MQEHIKQQFLRSSDEELQKVLYEYSSGREEAAFCRMLLEKRRHDVVEGRLNELKKPHWSVVPAFWLTLISALAAVAAAWFGWLGLKR